METSTSRDVNESRKFERDLVARLQNGGTQFADLEGPLVQVRNSCCNALIADYKVANAQHAEDRLWDSHQKVNAHYRSALAQLKKVADRRVVEQRKLGAEYLKFIKSSQKFYRGFIGKLAAAYGNIPALQRVAKKFDSAEPSPKKATGRGHPGTAELDLCCHRILIHLGDLSRYRESEFPHKEKDWAPAIGYYDLALTVCPNSGQPFNQRAVIALGSRSFFRATYYAYRSLTAVNPHPQAQDNLQRVMNMVQKVWEKQGLISEPNATAGSTLPNGSVAFFLRLINQYSQGIEPSERTELETEILAQVKDNIIRESQEAPPQKLVLIGFAAQHTAQSHFENQPESQAFQSSYILLLHFNIKLSICFLQVLYLELERVSQSQTAWEGLVERLTPGMRRALPIIHLYGAWMSKTSAVLASPVVPEPLQAEFWTTLARCLTNFSSRFPSQTLPNIEHLLDEEEDTIGFSPLHAAVNKKIWFMGEKLKPRWHDISTGDRDGANEMLYRIREFLVAGLRIALASNTPLKFDEELCIFKSDYDSAMTATLEPHSMSASPIIQDTAPEALSASEYRTLEDNGNTKVLGPATDGTEDFEAEKMVENLVGLGFDDEQCPRDVIHAGNTLSLSSAQDMFRNTEFGTSSPFPVGSSTVSDIMQKAFSGQPRTFSRNGTNATRRGSQPSTDSRLHSPVAPHPPVRVPSNESNRSSGWVDPRGLQTTFAADDVLPGLGVSPQQPPRRAFSPSVGARASPLPPPRNHSRVNSNDINPSIWSPGMGGSSGWDEAPTMSRRSSSRGFNLGNGTFGTTSPTSADFPATAKDSGAGQLTFGTTTNNPWEASYKAPKRLSVGSPLAVGNDVDSPSVSRYEGQNTMPRGYRPSTLQYATAQRMT